MVVPPADTLQPVELADGVAIHLRIAGPAIRSVAWLLDFMIYCVLLVVFAISLQYIADYMGQNTGSGIFMLGMFVLAWFYNVLFEMGRHAATPGQRMMGLKVVSITGAPVRLAQSLIRNLLRMIDFMPACYLTGLICCLFNQRFQRLGDLVADTVVVYAEPKPPTPLVSSIPTEPLAPTQPLNRAEQAALLQFLERSSLWSDARKTELSDLLEPLTGQTGASGLARVRGIAIWLQRGHTPPQSPLSS